jgi:hypothetical protein
MATPKKRAKPKRATAAPKRRQPRRAATPRPQAIPEAPPIAEVPELSLVAETAPAIESVPEPPLPLTTPETLFAERVPSSEPDRPYPASRRAIFFDVENTSRAQHIARVIEHLQIDHLGRRTEFFAVGNWRVIGHDTARLLAHYGAGLVHSAPSVGVRDWSDLRIAVAAGAWLASARPGDVIEIVSDDRAFDAVGDVAAGLGITFRRLSYRGLAGAPVEEAPAAVPERQVESRPAEDRRGQRYRGRYRGRHERRPGPSHAPVPSAHAAPPREVKAPEPVTPGPEPHTAPHDEIINVVHDLIRANPSRAVSIDTLANALKARGFSRPSGSPRLITRLRRLKEIELGRTGMITLVDSARGGEATPPPAETRTPETEETPEAEEAPAPSTHDAALSETVAEAAAPSDLDEDEGPQPGNERIPSSRAPSARAPSARTPSAPPASDDGNARRRRRRGGRRRRGRGPPQPTAAS